MKHIATLAFGLVVAAGAAFAQTPSSPLPPPAQPVPAMRPAPITLADKDKFLAITDKRLELLKALRACVSAAATDTALTDCENSNRAELRKFSEQMRGTAHPNQPVTPAH